MTLGTGRQGSAGEVAGAFVGVPARSTGAAMSCTVNQNHGLYGQNRPALRGPVVITSATSARCPPGVLRCECLQVSDGDAWLCGRLCPSRAGFIQGVRLSAGTGPPGSASCGHLSPRGGLHSDVPAEGGSLTPPGTSTRPVPVPPGAAGRPPP